jgi:5'-deoxynucleotidase YfbR-like HD superfamily hydrolase
MIDSPYVSTFLGHRFFLTRPHIDDVAIEDIAHGLAYQCRFNGQTREFYSVAQHSLMVMQLVPAPLRLAALLHDAAEAYLGDMVKPLKNLFPEFSVIEGRVMQIIGERFAVDLEHLDPAIKAADLVALATEKRDLMPHSTEAWANLQGIQPLPESIRPLMPLDAKSAFLDSFRQLRA